MCMEVLMDILTALRDEQNKLRHQLNAVETAITALNGSVTGAVHRISKGQVAKREGAVPRRTMSAAGRAAISKATKARWARVRAEKAKKAK